MLLYKKFLLISILVLSVFVTGCANRPESISASYMSHERFIDNNCQVLTTKMLEARSNLAKFSEIQNSKATEDAWGVFLLGVPFSKLSGDSEADVAKYKGMVEAIETAQIKRKCK
ncbi:MAG: hypothetical protein DSY43_02225 [Gammaproteobacteria bacterium]|nr:MAG: hypothetical protein DSY43_02225 [Gammaproteobacteria bacterium]